jgi:hypothetical protein
LKNVREISDDEHQSSDDQTQKYDIFRHRGANLIVADVVEKGFDFFGHERTPILVVFCANALKKTSTRQGASGTFRAVVGKCLPNIDFNYLSAILVSQYTVFKRPRWSRGPF